MTSQTLKHVTAVVLIAGTIVGSKIAYDEATYTAKVDAVAQETGLPAEKSESGKFAPVLTDVRLRTLEDNSVVAVAEVDLPDGGDVLVVYRESPCVIPDCPDDKAVVDCRGTGPYGETDGGGARWRGCNVLPRQWATGSACLPAACGTTAGEELGVIR